MIRKVIVIMASDLEQANELCNSIGAEGNTFSVPLFNSKNELYNYVCNWNMTDEQFEVIHDHLMFILFDSLDEALQTLNLHLSGGEEVNGRS